MNKINKAHVGADFDAFLAEEGTLAETTAIALKRVLAWKITQEMQDKNISKAEMARRMHTSRSALDRLLDPANTSVTLHTMDRAATALGGQLRLELVEDAGVAEPIPDYMFSSRASPARTARRTASSVSKRAASKTR